jgi:hypothetical protein
VPTVPEALSKELDDLETRFGEDRPAIELNLARFFLVIQSGIIARYVWQTLYSRWRLKAGPQDMSDCGCDL